MRYFLIVLFSFLCMNVFAQSPVGGMRDRIRNIRGATGGGGNDSLARRDKFEDSITVSYRYLDTSRIYKLDSSINDFSTRYPIPATYYYLGNDGNAAKSYLFSPEMKAGWDQGLHAYDIYKFTIDKARFFNTTRPYSEINYMLASRSEQYIELLHTQNWKPNWNTHFQYRFINSPGFYRNQKSAHNNYLVTNWYQSNDKRYNNYFVLVANKLKNTENGGIKDTADFMNNPDYNDRWAIPVWLGEGNFSRDFFNTSVATGNTYNDFNVLLRQQYDFGKKDSLVTDSTIIKLFYPRVRFEHSVRYSKYTYMFEDNNVQVGKNFYDTFYHITVPDTMKFFRLKDRWRDIENDFSVYTFPDAKNTQQYLKVGAAMQNLTFFDTLNSKTNYVNIYGHGEYRNRTRNQKWDMLAAGKVYFAGYNIGDYSITATIASLLGKKIGTLKLGFENTVRKPSFITNPLSYFYLDEENNDLKKEINTHLFADIYQPLLKLRLGGHYYLVGNYVYFSDYYKIQQAALFNVLQVSANKVFAFGKKDQWKWYADVYLQQVIGNAPVHVPLIFTRQRFGYEGNFGYRRLTFAGGLEARYRTNYKADNYSPLIGQFFPQDEMMINYKLPDITAYVHFRINNFKAFVRAENLNTLRIMSGNNGTSLGFTNNNFVAPSYAYPGLVMKLGVFWGFVN